LLVTGVIRNNWLGLKPFNITFKAFVNLAFVIVQLVAHAPTVLFSQMGVEIIKTGKPGLVHHEVAACVFHHSFDLALIIPFARAAKAILKKVMRYQLRERVIPPFVGLFETRITRPICTGSVS